MVSSSTTAAKTTSSVVLEPTEDDLITETRWPSGSCPVPNEQHILSIVCGTTRCSWALHTGSVQQYYPTLFWQTTPLPRQRQSLYQLIPPHVRTIIYGSKLQPTQQQQQSSVSNVQQQQQRHKDHNEQQQPSTVKEITEHSTRCVTEPNAKQTIVATIENPQASGQAASMEADPKMIEPNEGAKNDVFNDVVNDVVNDVSIEKDGKERASVVDDSTGKESSKSKDGDLVETNEKSEADRNDGVAATGSDEGGTNAGEILTQINDRKTNESMTSEEKTDPEADTKLNSDDSNDIQQPKGQTVTDDVTPASANEVVATTDDANKMDVAEPKETQSDDVAMTNDTANAKDEDIDQLQAKQADMDQPNEKQVDDVTPSTKTATSSIEESMVDNAVIADDPKVSTDSEHLGDVVATVTSPVVTSQSVHPASVPEEGESLTAQPVVPPRRRGILGLLVASTAPTIPLEDTKFYTPQRAVQYRSTFRVPALTIYIVSTDYETHVLGMASLFRTIPCRIFHLTNTDFIIPKSISLTRPSMPVPQPPAKQDYNDTTTTTKNAGIDTNDDYKGMNVDRLCLLHGVRYLYEPQKAFLIIDTGNTTTISYTATDRNGRLLGGGIAPSMSMKFRSMKDHSASALPHIRRNTFIQYVRECYERQQMQEQSSNTTISPIAIENAIISTVLKETVLSLSNVIKGWMDYIQIATDVKAPPSSVVTPSAIAVVRPSKSTRSAPPVLVLTGTDCDVIHMLLQPKHSYLCDASDGSDAVALAIQRAVQTEQMKIHVATGSNSSIPMQSTSKSMLLAHHGIQYMLLQHEQVKETTKTSMESVRETFLGQRVAYIPTANDALVGSIVVDLAPFPRRATVVYGSVMHIFRNDETAASSDSLEDDYYSIVWDESFLIDDVTPAQLYDRLILYTKANEAENELDERRKIKLQEKCNDAKAAAQLLAEKCDSVYSLIQSRLPESKRKPRPAMHPPPHLAAVAPPSEVPSRSASNKKKKDQSPATTGKRGRPKKDKVDAVARPGNSKKNQAAPSSAASQVTTSKKKRAIEKERAPSPSSSEDTSPIAKRQKKQSSKSMTPPTKSTSDGEIPYMNRRIAKDFDGEIYFGFVTGFVPSSTNAEAIDLWAITYDDGDAEDLEEDELMHGFLLYRKHKSGDEVGKTSAKRNQDKKKMKSGGSDKKSSRRK